MYNLKHLNTFVKVVECGSFNKVSDELYISPNAVMLQMNNLEEELGGISLFVRSRRGNKLTAAGECLYKEARDVLRYCNESQTRMMDICSKTEHVLKIAVSYGCNFNYFKKLWYEVHARMPELKLEIRPFIYDEKTDRALWRDFADWTDIYFGDVDVPDIIEQYHGLTFKGTGLKRVPFYCMASSNHRIASESEIYLSELECENVVMLSDEWGIKHKRLIKMIENDYPDIKLKTVPYLDVEMYNKCANGELIILDSWDFSGMHPFLTSIPLHFYNDDCTALTGFAYLDPPSPTVETFINLIEEIMNEQPNIV